MPCVAERLSGFFAQIMWLLGAIGYVTWGKLVTKMVIDLAEKGLLTPRSHLVEPSWFQEAISLQEA